MFLLWSLWWDSWAWLFDTLDAVLFPRDMLGPGEQAPPSIAVVQMFLGALCLSVVLYVVLRSYRAVYRAYQHVMDRSIWALEHMALMAAIMCMLGVSVCALWMLAVAPADAVARYGQWLAENLYLTSSSVGSAARSVAEQLLPQDGAPGSKGGGARVVEL